ncbi:RHS repeat-associated core domain-containing protein [Dyadobacter sp. NIV53]|uniref:RHS repeat-associated core domain-containing protein n=1 Tax=Dyadobacter sp. NIV53 TaxID=2861765 RepID=UPI0038D4A38E
MGLAIPRTAGTSKYNFIGREKQAETGYLDLMQRFYDPTTDRFTTIDPETEGQLEFSPHHYSFDNQSCLRRICAVIEGRKVRISV